MIFLIPTSNNNLVILNPAAPPPLIINFTSYGFFYISLRELITAAQQTMAVPC